MPRPSRSSEFFDGQQPDSGLCRYFGVRRSLRRRACRIEPKVCGPGARLSVRLELSRPSSAFGTIPLYNGVNLTKGYGVIGFHTPQEVVPHEDEDV